MRWELRSAGWREHSIYHLTLGCCPVWLCLAEACHRDHLPDGPSTRGVGSDEADFQNDGFQSGVVEREHKVPRVHEGDLRRRGMNGVRGTQLIESCRVQHFMELVVS